MFIYSPLLDDPFGYDIYNAQCSAESYHGSREYLGNHYSKLEGKLIMILNST